MGWRDTLFTVIRKNFQTTVTIDPRWAPKVPPFSLMFPDGTMIDTGPGLHAFTHQAAKIREHLVRNGGRSSREDLAKVLQIDKADSLRTTLTRAAKKGAIKIDGNIVRLPEKDGMLLSDKADGTDTPIK
jgi:hypothetical protein